MNERTAGFEFFASKSLGRHLLRGAGAVALLFMALRLEHAAPWTSLAAGLGALVLLRGCPLCWTAGLYETWVHRGAQRKRRQWLSQARL